MTNGKLTDYGAINVKHVLEVFNASGARLKEITELKQELHNKEREDLQKVRNDCYTKIRNLEAEKIHAEIQIETDSKNNRNAYAEEVIKHAANIQKVDRIIYFLQLDSKSSLDWKDKDVKCTYSSRQDHYFEAVGYLFDDEFMKIKLYIYGNTKPKNKYSLAVVGKTLFSKEHILNLPYYYGVDLNTTCAGFNIVSGLRDLPEIEDIKAWLNKNREKILQNEIKEYKQVKEEYLETIKNYDIKDFREIIKKNDK